MSDEVADVLAFLLEGALRFLLALLLAANTPAAPSPAPAP